MSAVEDLRQTLARLRQLGYTIRQECLAGSGGACELKGRKLFFLDLDLSPEEQLEQALAAVRNHVQTGEMAKPHKKEKP